MADLKRWPWALNQPGHDYPAENLRAQHFDATSGGNGVGSPTACKVVAQPAADGTVSILPGGATARSTYAGAEGQSYHMHVFSPIVVEVPPTGSASGGRHDLLVLRVSDPQYGDYPPGAPRRELTAEEAAGYDFWYPHLIQGTSANQQLDYPHVKLAHIRRGPNQTIVTDNDIHDLRVLAKGKSERFIDFSHPSRTEDLVLGGSYFTAGTISVPVPEWATVAKVKADMSGIPVLRGWAASRFNGRFPSFANLESTVMRGHAYDLTHAGTMSGFTARTVTIPPSRRGTVQDFEFRIQWHDALDNALVRVDGGTSLALDVTFEQGAE